MIRSLIRAIFIKGTTYYFVVPSDSSCFGSIVVKIQRNGFEYTISHACKENKDIPRCEHATLADTLIERWNNGEDHYSVKYKREHVVLEPELIQI